MASDSAAWDRRLELKHLYTSCWSGKKISWKQKHQMCWILGVNSMSIVIYSAFLSICRQWILLSHSIFAQAFITSVWMNCVAVVMNGIVQLNYNMLHLFYWKLLFRQSYSVVTGNPIVGQQKLHLYSHTWMERMIFSIRGNKICVSAPPSWCNRCLNTLLRSRVQWVRCLVAVLALSTLNSFV